LQAWALAAEKAGAAFSRGNAVELACVGGCLVTREASRAAFARRKRSMVASDMIEEIGGVMEGLFPCDS